MSDELDSTSLNKNNRVLKATADWLSMQNQPDIDQLVPKVETAMREYSICKDRLDKVQATLGQYFQKDRAKVEMTAPSTDGNGRAKKATSPSSEVPDDDQDIPS